MNIEIIFSYHNYSSCSYRLLEDPFIMHLKCKSDGGPKTTSLLCKNVFDQCENIYSKYEAKKGFHVKKAVNVADIHNSGC